MKFSNKNFRLNKKQIQLIFKQSYGLNKWVLLSPKIVLAEEMKGVRDAAYTETRAAYKIKCGKRLLQLCMYKDIIS